MFKKYLSSELGKGAIILFVTMNIFNVLNYLFHFAMAREWMLGPEGYGTLAVLMSIIYIYGIPTEAIQNIITKLTSKLNVKHENKKIKFLINKSLKKGFKIAVIIFLFSIIISIFLSYFLRINFWLILLTNLIVFISFSSPVARGVLQGRKKFISLGNSMIIESCLKLFFAISLVLFGFKVFGAMIGVLLGVFAGFIFSLYFSRDILSEKEKKVSFPKAYSMGIPYFLVMLAILLVFSLDIILAKRFFAPELAGKYAVLSMLGKMIYLGTFGISKAMFPLTSERKETNQNSYGLFYKSLILIIIICVISVLVYAIFPKLIISILFGSVYLEMAPYLVYSAIALSFLSLTNLVLIYGLSTDKLRKTRFLFIFVVIEVVLLSLFHDTILQYITSFMVSNIIMFIGSYFFLKR